MNNTRKNLASKETTEGQIQVEKWKVSQVPCLREKDASYFAIVQLLTSAGFELNPLATGTCPEKLAQFNEVTKKKREIHSIPQPPWTIKSNRYFQFR